MENNDINQENTTESMIMSGINAESTPTVSRVEKLSLDDLFNFMKANFSEVKSDCDVKFDKINSRFDTNESNFNDIRDEVKQINTRFEKINEKYESEFDKLITKVDSSLKNMDNRINEIDSSMTERINKQFPSLS